MMIRKLGSATRCCSPAILVYSMVGAILCVYKMYTFVCGPMSRILVLGGFGYRLLLSNLNEKESIEMNCNLKTVYVVFKFPLL